jgi:hypothetical protein
MKQILTVTTPAVSSMATLMFSKDPRPAPDMVNARLMKTAPKSLLASGTTGLWATAVWGTKPAEDRNTPPELPLSWDSSAVWTAAVATSPYGAN